MSNSLTLKNRQDKVETPYLKDWGTDSETGILRDA